MVQKPQPAAPTSERLAPYIAKGRLFFGCPSGAEATGACFTPDGSALFVSVQHPGKNSETLESPTTCWPTKDSSLPPRPAAVAVTRQGEGGLGA